MLGSGPLFCYRSGEPVSYDEYNQIFKNLVKCLGIHNSYTQHSARIGGATLAASLGFSEEQIKALGRWNSRAYDHYLCPLMVAL